MTKTVEGLLEDLIWQGAIRVWQTAQILQALQDLRKDVSTMPITIQQVLEVVNGIEGDTTQIENAVAVLHQHITNLETQVTDLQNQLANASGPVTQEQLDALAGQLQGAKAVFDRIVVAAVDTPPAAIPPVVVPVEPAPVPADTTVPPTDATDAAIPPVDVPPPAP